MNVVFLSDLEFYIQVAPIQQIKKSKNVFITENIYSFLVTSSDLEKDGGSKTTCSPLYQLKLNGFNLIFIQNAVMDD